jgi:hypothetical protein
MAWFLNEPDQRLATLQIAWPTKVRWFHAFGRSKSPIYSRWPFGATARLPLIETLPSQNVGRMAITIDDGADGLTWTTMVQLSDTDRLTIYDTMYLEFARRRRLVLATLDDELRSAASQAGIETLPLSG